MRISVKCTDGVHYIILSDRYIDRLNGYFYKITLRRNDVNDDR